MFKSLVSTNFTTRAPRPWGKDIERDFEGMNAVWAEWLPPRLMPTRATCEAKLASPELLVEIIVTAAARPVLIGVGAES
ncbi:hypothetical protein AD428_08495 [Achromobacter sp. DMS1]|nr:hypothetical protein AD428_08495 [Achromobacter sp. DMS1]